MVVRRARWAWGVGTALALVSGLTRAPAQAAPKLVVSNTRLDLGEITAGETAAVEFSLANRGDETLQIREVKVGCGCTTVSYPATLAPGAMGVLKATLAAATGWKGPVAKQITVLSNDPDQPAALLQLTATIRPLFRITPESPLAVRYQPGDVIRQVFTITSTTEQSIGITGIAARQPGIEARILPAESGDGPGVSRVEVTVRPPENAGGVFSYVVLQTAHPRLPTINLVVNGVREGGITVSPAVLYLPGLGAAPAAGPPRVVTLLKRGAAFQVREVRTDTPALQAELRPGDGTFYEIAVRYLGGLAKGKHAGKIFVTTDDPASPRIEIPYEATVE